MAEMSIARERSGRREQNKAENRAALLKAARTVFAEIGYNAAGVRDIVRRTDLASGTFYNYFKDKEEIFSAVIAVMSGELLARHRSGRAKATTTEEFFRRHCSVYFHFVAEDPEILAFGRNNVTPIRNLFVINTTQIYPEDRGTNYAVRLGRQVSALMLGHGPQRYVPMLGTGHKPEPFRVRLDQVHPLAC